MEGVRNEAFVEVAVVEYPGGDPSAASVLAEMAHVANRLAQQQRRPFKRVLVTRWIVPASQTGVHRIAGAEMLDAAIPAVIAVPGQISPGACLRAEEVLLDWLRAHYDGAACWLLPATGSVYWPVRDCWPEERSAAPIWGDIQGCRRRR